eukprot:3013016-Pyramimonas_sp.AAC.1
MTRSFPLGTKDSRARRSPPGTSPRLDPTGLQPSVTQVSPRQFRHPNTFRDISGLVGWLVTPTTGWAPCGGLPRPPLRRACQFEPRANPPA